MFQVHKPYAVPLSSGAAASRMWKNGPPLAYVTKASSDAERGDGFWVGLRLRCVEASSTLALWELPRVLRVRTAASPAFHSSGVRHGVVGAGGASQLR